MISREDVIVKSREVLYKGFNTLIELALDLPRLSGGRLEMSREVVLRPDAAAALVHDIERDVFILAEQFRPALYETGHAGWMVELVAGKIDPGESPEACIIREIEEEIGYRVAKVEPITAYYPAPALAAERMHLFYAPVKTADLVNAQAAGTDEGEDIRRVELPRAEFLDRLDKYDLLDPKTLVLSGWARKRFG